MPVLNPYVPGRFVLADLTNRCRVTSVKGALRVTATDGGYVVVTRDGVWKVTAGR